MRRAIAGVPRATRPPIERFMDKVQITQGGCWLWTAATNDYGYGMFGLGRRGEGVVRAHRWSYEHFIGPLPAGLFVCHRCDNPACVNPDHLFAGTNDDNVRDSVQKDRHARGQRNGHAKLTTADILAIRADTRLHREIAANYGVARHTISRIKSGARWGHVV